MSITFEIARPTEDHARLVMAWRNDPDTRQASFHRDEKTWPHFFAEFARDYFSYPDFPAVFTLHDGKRVGFLRFRPLEAPGSLRVSCDLSINIAPASRGAGLGVAILREIQDFLRQRGVDDVYAEIRLENQASQKAFARAGFECLGADTKLVADTGERCAIVRYRARLTPVFWADDRVFIIAEAGSNWRMGTPARDRAMARALIDVAAQAGANAVKFQTYRPETVYVANAGQSDYLAENGIKEEISSIFADLAMPYEMIPELADYCRECGIQFMSTPFAPADFAAIAPYVSVHKIASYEISHVRLLELAGREQKPLILSTGAAEEQDIAWAVDTFLQSGGSALCLMQCTAKYPAPPESMNLQVLPWLKKRFGVAVGLSDHSRHPTHAPLCAVALGARVIEKHYTLDNRLPGPDHAFALTPAELGEMVTGVRAAEKMLGNGLKTILPAEKELHSFARRGIQAVRDIAPGEALREGDNIAILRPGQRKPGLHPRFLAEIAGRPAARPIAAGDGISAGDWQEAA